MRARAWYAIQMMHESTGRLLALNIDYKVEDNNIKGAAILYFNYQHLVINYINESTKKAIDKYINDLTEKG